MRKFFIPAFMIFLPLTLVACGDDGTDLPSNVPEQSNDGGDWVYSFVVDEDGKSYRCFQSRDYRGGMWCTEKESF